ncbi:MAG: flavodoxin family protein [Candidatus Bathyarchaeota archaeon]|nr:flavodoxin family protein [Candidatus Bathyarchaeota archaeon]
MTKHGLQTTPMKSLLVLFSHHRHNTEKVANVFAEILDAKIKTPQEINPTELQEYNLIGFGSGIDSGKHYKVLLDFADKLPQVNDKKAFIFSTSGVSNPKYMAKIHTALREKLQTKGYVIVDEFNCHGFNTNSFLKLFGGMNKGRPNAKDLKKAEEIALNLKQKLEHQTEQTDKKVEKTIAETKKSKI